MGSMPHICLPGAMPAGYMTVGGGVPDVNISRLLLDLAIALGLQLIGGCLLVWWCGDSVPDDGEREQVESK